MVENALQACSVIATLKDFAIEATGGGIGVAIDLRFNHAA
jgi:hypothetical protein